jgi:hypothetical protein
MRGVSGCPGRRTSRVRVPFYLPHSIWLPLALLGPQPFAGIRRVVPTPVWPAPPSGVQFPMRPRDGRRRFARGARQDACGTESVTLPTNVVRFTLGA